MKNAIRILLHLNSVHIDKIELLETKVNQLTITVHKLEKAATYESDSEYCDEDSISLGSEDSSGDDMDTDEESEVAAIEAEEADVDVSSDDEPPSAKRKRI